MTILKGIQFRKTTQPWSKIQQTYTATWGPWTDIDDSHGTKFEGPVQFRLTPKWRANIIVGTSSAVPYESQEAAMKFISEKLGLGCQVSIQDVRINKLDLSRELLQYRHVLDNTITEWKPLTDFNNFPRGDGYAFRLKPDYYYVVTTVTNDGFGQSEQLFDDVERLMEHMERKTRHDEYSNMTVRKVRS